LILIKIEKNGHCFYCIYRDIIEYGDNFLDNNREMIFLISVLRISPAHNKGGLPDINIAQMLHLSNFFELKRRVYIHLQA
jgi:hypothetical protein